LSTVALSSETVPMLAIAPAGRIAAFVTASCCVALGVGVVALMADGTACDHLSCQREAAAAWLSIMLALGIVALGVAIALSAGRRPIEEDGATGWFWGLGTIFLASAIGAAVLVPAATCPNGGSPDATLGMCLLGHDRLPMTSWAWLERLIVVAGIAGALLLGAHRRHVWVNAAICVTALTGTMTWMLGGNV
jgi:hypothetical protein